MGEWDVFAELCKREFGAAPTPAEATVVVEEEEGEIVGFLCARHVSVAGPCWVHPKRRVGLTMFSTLISKMQQITRLKSAYVWTKDPALRRFYRILGLKSEGEVFSWRDE